MNPYRFALTAAEDPYPAYRELRDNDPVHYSEAEDVWVLTRHDDVSEAFRDWKTWSSQRRGNLLNDMPERIGKTLGTTDPPDHRFARALVEKAFTRKTVDGLAPRIAAQADGLAQTAAEQGSVELVGAVSAPFNAAILGALFGVPDADFLRLRLWLDDFFLREPEVPGEPTKQAVAMGALTDYLDDLAGERLRRPGGDLMSAMLVADVDGRKLSRERVVVTTMTFLTAGFESTNNLLTNLVHALARHPDACRRIRDDPAMLPECVEEAMRWDAPAQGFVRTPTRAVRMHGTTVPKGSQVLLHIGSANRDERAFENPDRFDIDRADKRHLGMGRGIHFCVGAPLGREMAQAMLRALVRRSAAWEVDPAGARRVTTPNFRGFSALPLRIQRGSR